MELLTGWQIEGAVTREDIFWVCFVVACLAYACFGWTPCADCHP